MDLERVMRRPRSEQQPPVRTAVRRVLAELPPAFVVLGGCDALRDEGRAYAERLREAGVEAEEVCFAGLMHGFMNHMFPAAADGFEQIGTWVRTRFEATRPGTA
ncbi:alpha/beta hydrolase [Streptomyces mirabilis]|nr:alpha/beta hydrolase [Streptomyces mirabilis]